MCLLFCMLRQILRKFEIKILFPSFFRKMLVSAFLLRFKANYLEKMCGCRHFSFWIPKAFAKIYFFRMVPISRKNLRKDLFHNGDQIQYSFALMLVSLTNLAAMHKIQKNIWNKVRLVSLININTKEWQNKPPFMKVVYLVGTVLGNLRPWHSDVQTHTLK